MFEAALAAKREQDEPKKDVLKERHGPLFVRFKLDQTQAGHSTLNHHINFEVRSR